MRAAYWTETSVYRAGRLGGALALTLALGVAAAEAPGTGLASPPGLGLWVWGEAPYREAPAREALLAFCARHRFTEMAVTIPLPPADAAAEAAVRALLAGAAAGRVRVSSLRGDPHMAFPEVRAQELAQIRALLEFNAPVPAGERLEALRYDVEPYGSERWRAGDEERRKVQAEFLDLLRGARDLLHGAAVPMRLVVDIPFWYDVDELVLEYGGQRQRLSEHVQDLADAVVLMSYRPQGSQVLELVRNEVEYAARLGRLAWAGIETGRITGEEAFISFANHPVEHFWEQVRYIQENGRAQPGYGGLYVHHYGSLLEYLPR